MYRKILKQIKKHNNIVIARHIGPDPDALGSSIALKEIIKENFPKKKVYVTGTSASRFKYFGQMDKFEVNDALLIITDTPDKKRVDILNIDNYKYKIKIDHHPFIEKFCDLELIDDKASSACQIIIEFALKCHLKIPYSAASKLYMGLVSDTERFLHNYTTYKTFELVAKLIKETNLDFTKLYPTLYNRNLNEIKFNAYLANNLIVTENKVGYVLLDNKTLKEHNVDSSTAGNLINNFFNIEEILIVVFGSEDVANNYIKCSIRSRGPIINEIASHYNGGGHQLASGAKPKDFEEASKMIKELDLECEKYIKESKLC